MPSAASSFFFSSKKSPVSGLFFVKLIRLLTVVMGQFSASVYLLGSTALEARKKVLAGRFGS